MKPTATRKILSLCLAALLLAALFPAAGSAFAAGDVDGDGVVRASDARLCLRRAVGLEDYPAASAAFTACDLSGDGAVTAEDARLILRAAVGLTIDDGLSGRTVLGLPTTVYAGRRGSVTLTEYISVESGPLAEGPYLVCVLQVTDTSGMRYTVGAQAVTVDGVRLPDGDETVELPPNGSANVRIVIPGAYLRKTPENDYTADEILARIPFFSPTENRTYYAKIAVYPTGKPAGTVVYNPAAPVSVAQETDDFLFGFNGADYLTATDAESGARIADVNASFYFRSKSNRELTVALTDVSLNEEAVPVPAPAALYVFPGTEAAPALHITASFFSEHRITALDCLTYTVVVRDAKTAELLLQKTFRIRGISERGA